MVEETRVGARLSGPRADLAAIRDTLLALARLILSLPEVSDAEVNPLLYAPDGAVALDARILLAR
jgi:hypothetical protein